MRGAGKIIASIIAIFFLATAVAWAAPPGNNAEWAKKQQEEQAKKQEAQNKKTAREARKAERPKPSASEHLKRGNNDESKEAKIKKKVVHKPQPNVSPAEKGNTAAKHEVRKHNEHKPPQRHDPNRREDLRAHWHQERREYRSHQRPPSYPIFRKRTVYHNEHWQRHYHDWTWFGAYRFANVWLYHGRHSDAVISARFDGHYRQQPHYLDDVRRHYGHHSYKKRWHHHDRDGWAYFWVGRETIIRVFIGDDGYITTMLWRRADIERQAIELGYISHSGIAYFGCYQDNMPEEVAGEYIEDVLSYVEEE